MEDTGGVACHSGQCQGMDALWQHAHRGHSRKEETLLPRQHEFSITRMMYSSRCITLGTFLHHY